MNELQNKKERDPFFDNAKFLLIFLVVLAHGISPLKKEHDTVYMVWYTINCFHMPCFIFLSGFFAKKYIQNGKFNIQKPFYYLMLFLFSQAAVWCFEYFVLKDVNISKSVVAARSSLWYLQCLVTWYVLLPFMDKLKPKYMLVIAFALSLLMGYDEKLPGAFSVSRVLVHLPFFLLGYYCTKERLQKLVDGKWKKPVALLIFGAVALVTFFKRAVIPERIIVASYQYQSIKSEYFTFHGMWLARAAFYVLALALCWAFLVWVPRKKMFFTRFGNRTLQVYIGHRFLYLAELKYGWGALFNNKGMFFVLLGIITATVFILSLKIFEYPFQWIAKIKIAPLLKESERPEGGK